MKEDEFKRLMQAVTGYLDTEPTQFLLIVADKEKILVGSSCPHLSHNTEGMRDIMIALKARLDKESEGSDLKCH